MKNDGFTLIEVMIAGAIFSVVGILSFVVLSSSNEAAAFTDAKSAAQANLRDTMTALTAELGVAFTSRLAGTASAAANAAPVKVTTNGQRITFQVPLPGVTWGSHTVPGASTPIAIFFDNEDLNGNGLLDTGEDTDGDGTLNRRLVRVQDGVEEPLGGANDLSGVSFALVPSAEQGNNQMTRVNVWLEATPVYGPEHKKVSAELEAQIRLAN